MLAVYLAGVAIGLVATQGGLGTRVVLAALWPLGPLAFVLVSAGLLLIAAVVFPVFGVILATAAAGLWWSFRW